MRTAFRCIIKCVVRRIRDRDVRVRPMQNKSKNKAHARQIIIKPVIISITKKNKKKNGVFNR